MVSSIIIRWFAICCTICTIPIWITNLSTISPVTKIVPSGLILFFTVNCALSTKPILMANFHTGCFIANVVTVSMFTTELLTIRAIPMWMTNLQAFGIITTIITVITSLTIIGAIRDQVTRVTIYS